jgi:hypothetical protein
MVPDFFWLESTLQSKVIALRTFETCILSQRNSKGKKEEIWTLSVSGSSGDDVFFLS